MHNILLGVTGSVATIRTRRLIDALKKFGDVQIVATKAANYFLKQSKADFSDVKIHVDVDEWPETYVLGDEILHIELRRWASCLILAPLDANTLAKINYGLCDNLLTSVVRAWDWTKPIFAACSMNTYMWENDPTGSQVKALAQKGVYFLDPVEKRLACGDVGVGGMASVESIVNKVNEKLRWFFPLKNCNGIPINHHPGAFGFHRKKNHHTGVDLYCKDNEDVHAVEDGTVVKVDYFTGKRLGHDWWEETWGVMVEGASGVINYGEVVPFQQIQVGAVIRRGDIIARVKRVLFEDKFRPDIPGHSTSMLHLELYKNGTREFADWHDPQKNPTLLDPTPYLMISENGPRITLTWDNNESKTVG